MEAQWLETYCVLACGACPCGLNIGWARRQRDGRGARESGRRQLESLRICACRRAKGMHRPQFRSHMTPAPPTRSSRPWQGNSCHARVVLTTRVPFPPECPACVAWLAARCGQRESARTATAGVW
ncbi:hypothetical protein GQ54DRAFT_110419 [Martensiomyces pterosporus]|nr:hypothetical protein GQ54DRAFT_110419 [Martensiomyces pterosporus]